MAEQSVAQHHQVSPAIAERVRRGIALYWERGAEIVARPAGGISVPSCTGERSYRVSLAPARERCGCPDHQRRGEPCKHIYAALLWSARS